MKGAAVRQERKGLSAAKILAMVAFILLLLFASGCSSSKKDAGSTAQFGAFEDKASSQNADSVKGKSEESAKVAVAAKSLDANAVTPLNVANQYGTALTNVSQTGSSGFSATDGSEGLSRKLIYKANVTMEVANYEAAQVEIQNLVALTSGYVLQFSENQSSAEQSGNFVIKLPANGFSAFLKDLEKIKHVTPLRHNIQGQDVSEEYVDLASRLKAKQVVEARLLSFMEKATKTDELLSFSNELGKVQEEIEKIKGRTRYLDQNVALSTVELRLYQRGAAEMIINNDPNASVFAKATNAMKASVRVLKIIFQGIVVFLAGAFPVLIVLAVIFIPVMIALKRSRLKANAAAEARRVMNRRSESDGAGSPSSSDQSPVE